MAIYSFIAAAQAPAALERKKDIKSSACLIQINASLLEHRSGQTHNDCLLLCQ